MALYVSLLYCISVVLCTFGLYHGQFNANLLQRVAIVLYVFWAIWRIGLLWGYGVVYPREPLVATAIALFAAGSFLKALQWRFKQ